MNYHKPVLYEEVLAHLQVKKSGKYIDGTLGDAGHTLGILKSGGIVLGIEINNDALERAKDRIEKEGYGTSFTGVLGNFKQIDILAREYEYSQVDGILLDLGYSSFQLDEGGFGLSFLKEEALDMRLDKGLGVSAADLVNVLPEKELTEMFIKYSQEHLAKKFAKAIIKYRNLKKIQTTKQLADLLKAEASPGYEHGRIHPATRIFQALRIAVNDELVNLEEALPRAARLLLPGGKLLVISFHSLEDSIVKDYGLIAQPSIKMVNKSPITPTLAEISENNRARSAKLRVFEKTNEYK